MPRGTNLSPSQTLLKALILGDPKAGKTDWTMRAAEAGFNVLYMDGDVAGQTVAGLSNAAKNRIFYMDIADKLDGGVDPHMIQTVADFFTTSRFLWNDSKQRAYSRAKDEHDPETGAALDEIWEFRPGKLDHNWVLAIDSWTTLSYSAMLAKAQDQGVSLADVEKIERGLYQGVGNRLTNILATIQKAPCHIVVIGHPAQYEKTASPSGKTVREVKETDRVIEWTKMIPKSSSNPHGLTMGKFFSDIGWIDVDKFGKRKLNFKITSERVSGGHLEGAGDPRGEFDFASVIRAIGGKVPDLSAGDPPLGEGLIIHPAGTFIPAAAKSVNPLASKSAASTTSGPLTPGAKPTAVKGLGGLAGLKKQ